MFFKKKNGARYLKATYGSSVSRCSWHAEADADKELEGRIGAFGR